MQDHQRLLSWASDIDAQAHEAADIQTRWEMHCLLMVGTGIIFVRRAIQEVGSIDERLFQVMRLGGEDPFAHFIDGILNRNGIFTTPFLDQIRREMDEKGYQELAPDDLYACFDVFCSALDIADPSQLPMVSKLEAIKSNPLISPVVEHVMRSQGAYDEYKLLHNDQSGGE